MRKTSPASYSLPAMTKSLITLTSKQLRQAADLKAKIEVLEKELTAILGAPPAPAVAVPAPAKKKGGMSPAGKARLVAAQKARWAKIKAEKAKNPAVVAKPVVKAVLTGKATPVTQPAKKKWKLSAAGLAKIKAANQAYWAKKKAAKKG